MVKRSNLDSGDSLLGSESVDKSRDYVDGCVEVGMGQMVKRVMILSTRREKKYAEQEGNLNG